MHILENLEILDKIETPIAILDKIEIPTAILDKIEILEILRFRDFDRFLNFRLVHC